MWNESLSVEASELFSVINLTEEAEEVGRAVLEKNIKDVCDCRATPPVAAKLTSGIAVVKFTV